MKITRQYLRQIIKEEINRLLEENEEKKVLYQEGSYGGGSIYLVGFSEQELPFELTDYQEGEQKISLATFQIAKIIGGEAVKALNQAVSREKEVFGAERSERNIDMDVFSKYYAPARNLQTLAEKVADTLNVPVEEEQREPSDYDDPPRDSDDY